MEETDWVRTAVGLVETAIQGLADDFKADPYEHRVEHSLHVKLFSLLVANQHLQGLHPIGDGKFRTGRVHKEWPGQKPVEYDNGGSRRQTFDIAVMSPHRLAQMDKTAFAEGRVDPPIAIELGLDYNIRHLKYDIEKMKRNAIQHRYIVHFSRKRTRKAAQVRDHLEAETACKWVFVHIDSDSLKLDFGDLKGNKIEIGVDYVPADHLQRG